MAYSKSKDLTKRTQSGKGLRDKAFKVPGNPKYDGYQRGLVSMVYKFFDKNSSGNGIATEPNCQLANELHRQIIRKNKKFICYLDTTWVVDLADMQSLRKYQKGIKYLLCAIDLFSKYARVAPLKDKRGISIVDTFQKNNLKRRETK